MMPLKTETKMYNYGVAVMNDKQIDRTSKGTSLLELAAMKKKNTTILLLEATMIRRLNNTRKRLGMTAVNNRRERLYLESLHSTLTTNVVNERQLSLRLTCLLLHSL